MDILKSLEAFIAVATVHSVSEAGRSLNLTASAVSKQLSALEQHVGATLISRTTHGINLTNAGQSFLPRAIAVVDELSSALNDVRTPPANRVGSSTWRHRSSSGACTSLRPFRSSCSPFRMCK